MKRLFLVASLVAALKATCIVGIVEKNQVILAADSLEVHPGGPPSKVCKIITDVGGRAAAALDGLVADRNTGFDLASIARESLRAGSDLNRDVVVFRRAAMSALAQELGQQQLHAPQMYAARLSKHLASAVFAGMRRGTPVLWVKAYEAGADGTVAEYRSNELLPADTGRVIVLCEHAPVLMRARPELRALPALELARTLVELDIEQQRPERPLSGAPVAIVQIDRSGMQWVEPGACGPATHDREEIGVAGEE